MKKSLILLSLFFLISSISFGALVEDYDISTGAKATVYDTGDSTLKYHINTGDLINGVRGVIFDGSFHSATLPSDPDQRLDTLTDGAFAAEGLSVIASDYAYTTPSIVIEYSFSPPVDINDIKIFSGHDGDGSRAWINAKIEADKGLGYYTVIENLKTGAYDQLIPGDSTVAVVRLYDDGSGWVASHVEKIRFSIYAVSNSFAVTNPGSFQPPGPDAINGAILKEIDISGVTPSAITDWNLY